MAAALPVHGQQQRSMLGVSLLDASSLGASQLDASSVGASPIGASPLGVSQFNASSAAARAPSVCAAPPWLQPPNDYDSFAIRAIRAIRAVLAFGVLTLSTFAVRSALACHQATAKHRADTHRGAMHRASMQPPSEPPPAKPPPQPATLPLAYAGPTHKHGGALTADAVPLPVRGLSTAAVGPPPPGASQPLVSPPPPLVSDRCAAAERHVAELEAQLTALYAQRAADRAAERHVAELEAQLSALNAQRAADRYVAELEAQLSALNAQQSAPPSRCASQPLVSPPLVSPPLVSPPLVSPPLCASQSLASLPLMSSFSAPQLALQPLGAMPPLQQPQHDRRRLQGVASASTMSEYANRLPTHEHGGGIPNRCDICRCPARTWTISSIVRVASPFARVAFIARVDSIVRVPKARGAFGARRRSVRC